MMSKRSSTTPGKKSSKSDDKEFNTVLRTLEKEKQAIAIPQPQINMFYGAGIGVAAIPLALHVSDLSAFISYIIYFIIGVAGSSALLSMSYMIVANKSRRSLYISKSRGLTKETDGDYADLVQSLDAESSSYALWTVNLSFLVGFLFFAMYFLRPYSLPAHFHFILATAIPSGLTFAVSRFY